MDLKGLGVELCVKYVLPFVQKILSSAISKISKRLYERLYTRFKTAVDSFENALKKLGEANDQKSLKKRLACCKLGLSFFEQIYKILDELLPEYSAAIEDAEEKLNRGEEV